MKITQEEQIKEIKAVIKSLKKDGAKVTKAKLTDMCVYYVTYLLKALAKAQKPSV